jgi:EAL domain-containing protein (putative c-di-GMP-specific phosphodiesterase class I)
LKRYNLQPADLTIELTESVLLTNIDAADSPADKMTNQGIKDSTYNKGISLAYQNYWIIIYLSFY